MLSHTFNSAKNDILYVVGWSFEYHDSDDTPWKTDKDEKADTEIS